MKFALGLFLFCFTVTPVFAQQKAAGPSVPDKEAVTARFAAVNTIESRFTQQKFMALLEEPVTSEGVFYFEKPSRIRWQYTKPFQNGFLITDGVTYRLEKDKKEEQKNPLAHNIAVQLLAWLTFDLEALSKQYAVEFTADGVVLTPLKKGFINRIKVTFSAQNKQALSKVEILENGGDKTVLRFTHPKTNHKLPAEAFQ